jgi:flagellar assembly protein FliH
LSNSIIPKEQQSAYQRWEMASFGDDRPGAQAAKQPVIVAPTAEEVALIRANAKVEAYTIGEAKGKQNGYAEGLARGKAQALAEGREQTAKELAFMREISATFGEAINQADISVAQDMLDLALDLAKALLKTALAVRPELVLIVIRDAIDQLPSLQQPALLYLHPEDTLLVKEHIGDELTKSGWKLMEDPQLARGGCRIDTPSNQIDADTGSRWRRLAAALGKDLDWLAP